MQINFRPYHHGRYLVPGAIARREKDGDNYRWCGKCGRLTAAINFALATIYFLCSFDLFVNNDFAYVNQW